MNRLFAKFILVGLWLVLAVAACIISGDQKLGISGSASVNQATIAAQATATYGAEQFYIQLTAIAQPEP